MVLLNTSSSKPGASSSKEELRNEVYLDESNPRASAQATGKNWSLSEEEEISKGGIHGTALKRRHVCSSTEWRAGQRLLRMLCVAAGRLGLL